MIASPGSCPEVRLTRMTSSPAVFSSSSHFLGYSNELKHRNTVSEEQADYSHITPYSRQNYKAVHVSQSNHPPVAEGSDTSLSHASIYSSTCHSRQTFSPNVGRSYYSPTHYGSTSSKQSQSSDRTPKEKTYCNLGSDVSHYGYTKHPVQVSKLNNVLAPPYHHSAHRIPDLYLDSRTHYANSQEPILSTFQPKQPQVPSHNNAGHYRQPQPGHGHNSSQAEPEPPYSKPPHYSYQHHARRKTWSPPTLKMSLLNEPSRVSYSNGSLELTQEEPEDNRAQNLKEDLDVTPPRLAPVSGVLAQNPGMNLIKPIAFKPVLSTQFGSPAGLVNQQHKYDPAIGQHGPVKSPDSVWRTQDNRAGAFSSSCQLTPLSPTSVPACLSHSQSLISHSDSAIVTSSRSSWKQKSTIPARSHFSNSNTYSNLPLTSSSASAKSSHSGTSNEGGGSGEYSHSCRSQEVAHTGSQPGMSGTQEGLILRTPSPSDSGVGELEAILREKDYEISALRQVMEQNERAIFQVYEERRNNWIHDTQELQNNYEKKLKQQSHKSSKTEQTLAQQLAQLQQDQRLLQEENSQLKAECHRLKQTTSQLPTGQQPTNQQPEDSRLDPPTSSEQGQLSSDTDNAHKPDNSSSPEQHTTHKESLSIQEELLSKNKELITLKAQLHSFQVDIDKKNRDLTEKARELSATTEEVKSLRNELAHLKAAPVYVDVCTQTHAEGSQVAVSENMKPSLLGERDRVISSLREELADTENLILSLKDRHAQERDQWLDEKNRVVRYQKQLQLNYVQMQRKNATLEAEVHQLTLELESRDMKLTALTGEESVC